MYAEKYMQYFVQYLHVLHSGMTLGFNDESWEHICVFNMGTLLVKKVTVKLGFSLYKVLGDMKYHV